MKTWAEINAELTALLAPYVPTKPQPTIEAILADPTGAAELSSQERNTLLAQAGGLITVLAASSLTDGPATSFDEPSVGSLLTAAQLAERLNVKQSWVMAEARAGRIPVVKVGRYPRFDFAAVRTALGKE